jgi:Ca2+-transporting ATPase
MGHALAIRSRTESFFSMSLLSNKPLLGAVLLTFLLQIAVTYLPFLQTIFKTQSLTFSEFIIVGAISSLVFIVLEIEKAIRRRINLKKQA